MGHDVLDVYGTFPLTEANAGEQFTAPILDVARWSEAAGLRGLLVFTDNDSLDPWAAAQFLLERTAGLVPLVAAQPVYMHPYTAARKVSTLASLYGRRVDLNLVTGGYRPHLRALGDELRHDERYARLVEYGEIMAELLATDGPVTRRGAHFEVNAAVMNPPMPAGVRPRVFVAGTSPAAAAAAARLGATRLMYPRSPDEYAGDPSVLAGVGVRVGIIARDTSEAAWAIARRRYPYEPVFEEFREFAVPDFDAQWHDEIWSDSDRREYAPDGAYWLYPFRISREFCPYLVGSHAEVAQLLSRYLAMGSGTLILNEARSEDDVFHAVEAIRQAERIAPPVATT
ncbi:LLM class flavin-dependent oxidoreductase [Rugosimonospora africana]|uniref:Oxidoreductase n=1 Tax=Rugosimonospora africana TaxID=556532 RepID=A0A8J3R107_9ACTN|nr:LLM class flavin-dependent oxidoreductase [Rugosimonospora africana]GIH19613.1 oxidoreductase [Rugosimonospora africana]